MAEEKDLSIESKLREAWQQEWRYFCIRGASRFVVWLIALLALDFLIDWGLFAKSGMSGNIGVFLLLVNLAVLGWVLWFDWLRYLKPYDPVMTSLEVEKQHPGLTSLLVSYTQLKEPADDQPNVSQGLIEAMREQAVERSRRIDFREIVDFAQLKKLFGVSGGVLLVFGVLSIQWSEHFGVLLKRLAGGDVGYPTKTQVVSVRGDLTVRVGDPATITARAGGVMPAAGRIFTKAADSEEKWKELPMKASAKKDTFARELKGLAKDLLYYVRLGDDKSREYRIHVIDSPQIVGQSLVLEYPSYMNRDPGKSDQLNLEVPEGTKLKWTVKCDPPVASCKIKVGGRQFANKDSPGQEGIEIDAQVDDLGTSVTFDLTAEQALKYTFKWTEREQSYQYEDVQYAVKVTTDSLPDIDLLEPRETSGIATLKKVLNFQARAGDDIGLSQAWLVYSVDGAEEQRTPIFDFAGATNKTFDYSWILAEAIEDLKTNSRITFALEVADHHPKREAHLRRSATRQLTIVDSETYLLWYRQEVAAQNEELKRSRDQEISASKAVEQMKTEEGVPKKNEN
ncbi:MAG: hypothetical protein ABGZ49_02755 [Akkermansiaceae bacterium]|nr:hypothetical protein [Roseibacillus sp.]|tara:strand:- start:704 stop:2404 length:1701 start_codon:yes stop_codon:yes gene_type:complete